MFGVPHRHAGMWCVWRAEVAKETEQGLQGLCPLARGIRGTKQAQSRHKAGKGPSVPGSGEQWPKVVLNQEAMDTARWRE